MTPKPRIIFVAGGVISGVGKGIATASIARILKEHGFSVTAVKIDPYINYDAGTLRPTEHGEVWVTDDGGEIDQDLGNYERFLGMELPKRNNITTGQIYKELIDRERRGEFLGQTVEVIPHVPNEIKRRIMEAGAGFDFIIVEVGGTVGDLQNLPYLFAAKGLELELGRENVAYVLVTYLPVPANIGEMKTKPTQQAVRMLNETGIFPDFLLCRAPVELDDVRKKKLETNANIAADHVISAPDIKTIYKAPLNFEKEGLGRKILERLSLEPRKEPQWRKWKELVERLESPSRQADIAIVGKYVDSGAFTLADSYISINQSLEHAGAEKDCGINIHWIDSKQFERDAGRLSELEGFSGIIIPGGFGSSGVEGKISAIRFSRENNIPFLGLCYGMQLAAIEYARNVCGMEQAHTTEIDPKTEHPVIDILSSQIDAMAKSEYGGTMRLGAYAAELVKSKVAELYEKTGRIGMDALLIEKLRQSQSQRFRLGMLSGEKAVLERHRHRFEVNPKYAGRLQQAGLHFPGFHTKTDGTKLMEFLEIPQHRFFVGTQAHPEFKSYPGNPAPLFLGFVEACLKG